MLSSPSSLLPLDLSPSFRFAPDPVASGNVMAGRRRAACHPVGCPVFILLDLDAAAGAELPWPTVSSPPPRPAPDLAASLLAMQHLPPGPLFSPSTLPQPPQTLGHLTLSEKGPSAELQTQAPQVSISEFNS